MPPKKKQAPKGPFYFMMLKVQRDYRDKGISKSLDQVKDEAGELWKRMSKEDKEFYEVLAKQDKEKMRGTLVGKLNSEGNSIQEVLKEEERIAQLANKQRHDIQQYVTNLGSVADIANHNLYAISFNILVEAHNEYFPLEVGIIEYSILNGITKTFHKFINPGPAPLGFASLAKEHSDSYHGIPPVNFQQGDSDYFRIVKEIKSFIHPIKEEPFPVLWCRPEQIPQVKGCLDFLHDKTGELHNFKVWDILYLIIELRNAADSNIYQSEAEDILNSAVFAYSPNSLCQFHYDLDNNYCALGESYNLGYKLSDSLCHPYKVVITANHFPPRVDESIRETVQVSFPDIRPLKISNRVNSSHSSRSVSAPPVEPSTLQNAKSIFTEYEETTRIPSAFPLCQSPGPQKQQIKPAYKTACDAVKGKQTEEAPFLSEEDFPAIGEVSRPSSVSSWSSVVKGFSEEKEQKRPASVVASESRSLFRDNSSTSAVPPSNKATGSRLAAQFGSASLSGGDGLATIGIGRGLMRGIKPAPGNTANTKRIQPNMRKFLENQDNKSQGFGRGAGGML